MLISDKVLAETNKKAWWTSPENFRQKTNVLSKPLDGLCLALDPGHIGGKWADFEGRNFRISEDDYWVREGELVLEVARRIETQLEILGANVVLVRETFNRVNPKPLSDYWKSVEELNTANQNTPIDEIDHLRFIPELSTRNRIISEELIARAHRINKVIQPDALISLHINAAKWSEGKHRLVDVDHSHVIIFGCLTEEELSLPEHLERLAVKLKNGSGFIEEELAVSLGRSLSEATGLPASKYEGENAVLLDADIPEVWARNLLLLRLVDCPAVMLEPYIANSKTSYPRLQQALSDRAANLTPSKDDILVEYSDAVVDGLLRVYTEN